MLKPRPGIEDYASALRCLNSLQTGHAKLSENRKAGRRTRGIEEIEGRLGTIGYSVADLNNLNVIHVAGTKGKGSTCAFLDSILEEHRIQTGRPRRIGLYTSPHIQHVRERIRINSVPISERLFARYFFEVWKMIEACQEGEPFKGLGYFRFLTLLSFYVFLKERIDVVICETGVGGEYDSTNIVREPIATGITNLGIDHVRTLGPTIQEIAWHKAGIFKQNCPAFSVPQQPEAFQVLKDRASERGAILCVTNDKKVDQLSLDTIQKQNASLAVALVEASSRKLNLAPCLSDIIVRGIYQTYWPGRLQILRMAGDTWYLDGAHTEDSLDVTTSWFAQHCRSMYRHVPRILIFNQQSLRDGEALLRRLFQGFQHNDIRIGHAIFCTNTIFTNTPNRPDVLSHNNDPEVIATLEVQKGYQALWANLDSKAQVECKQSVQEAIDLARSIGQPHNGMQALIVGSLYLVGGVISILEPELDSKTFHRT